jgi:hypothetical protein
MYIFTNILKTRLFLFLSTHFTLYNNQFGFHKKHSTKYALICLIDKITSAIENNEFTIGLFLDLSKAFDTVNHSILLYKLEPYGIRGLPLQWICSYLTHRKQYVCNNHCKSENMFIKCSVPQWSI